MQTKSNVIVGETGFVNTKADAQKLTKQYMRTNNKIANLVEKREDCFEQLKNLREQKKLLCKEIDRDIKQIKDDLKIYHDDLLFQLGKRKGEQETLTKLGLSIEDKSERKKITAKAESIIEVQ